MELERTQADFNKRGLKVAAAAHDSVAVLKHFADRKGLSYPLLSNREGRLSASFGIVNHHVPQDDANYGMPFPGTYIVDENGVVEAKFFEEDHGERHTAATMLTKHFREPSGRAVSTVETKHLKLTTSASEETVRPGNLVTLAIEVELGEKMHVYAPGVEGGYIPIRWTVENTAGWAAAEALYPESKMMHLPAINETVPVHEGTFTVKRDLVIGQNNQLKPLLQDGKIVVEGEFRYQACDEKICYRPQSVPLRWEFTLGEHDRQRAPEELR